MMPLDAFVPGGRKGLLLLAVIGFLKVSTVPGAQRGLEQAPQNRGFSSYLKRRDDALSSGSHILQGPRLGSSESCH